MMAQSSNRLCGHLHFVQVIICHLTNSHPYNWLDNFDGIFVQTIMWTTMMAKLSNKLCVRPQNQHVRTIIQPIVRTCLSNKLFVHTIGWTSAAGQLLLTKFGKSVQTRQFLTGFDLKHQYCKLSYLFFSCLNFITAHTIFYSNNINYNPNKHIIHFTDI